MVFVLIFIILTLAVVTGFQFLYLAYLGSVEIEHKKHIRNLELTCKTLRQRLSEAESKINRKLPSNDDDLWADVIVEK